MTLKVKPIEEIVSLAPLAITALFAAVDYHYNTKILDGWVGNLSILTSGAGLANYVKLCAFKNKKMTSTDFPEDCGIYSPSCRRHR